MSFGRSLAVAIGVDAYTALPGLECAVADAVAVGDVLEAQGYTVERLVTPAHTTAEAMRSTFEGLVERLGPDDRLLIYFAGHGIAEDDEGGEPQGYLAPIDAGHEGTERLLPMAWLYDLVCARITCRHRLLVLDCCFAGRFQWSATRMTRRRRRGAATLYRNRFERFVGSPAAQVLTSAASDQKALDVVGGLTIGRREVVGGHSPFATALLDGLTGAADTDTGEGRDGILTATELYLYVRDAVEHHTRGRQTPGLWTIKGHVRGEYVFTPTGQPDLDQLPEDPRLDAAANPWPGLVPYSTDQTALFFGRTAEVEALRARLDPADTRWLIAVVAASGTGKSSLVRAGLLPRLGDDWSVLGPIRPGEDPAATLAAATRGLDDARDQLLVVDQLEEVFTLGCDEAGRRAFVDALVELGRRPRLRVLITLRADFEAYAASTALGPHLAVGRFALGPMTRDGLREVIERPAERRVLFFEPPGLVTRLIDEVVALPGGLPLLSFALSEMYRAYVESDATDRGLTAAHYDDLGGVVGALRTRATALLAAADPAERAALRRVMLRLVSGDAEQTRRRATEQELTFADPAEQRRVDTVVARFVTHRLLVRGAIERPDGVGEPFVEPAHDALVRGWSELYIWLAAARDTLPLQRAVWRAAHTWHHGDEDPGLLWDADPRLAQAFDPAVMVEFNALEQRFVAASDRRRRRRRLTLFAAVVLAMTVLAGVAIYALDEADRANAAERRSERVARRAEKSAERSAASAERARQRRLLAEALRLEPVDPTRAALVALEIDDLSLPLTHALLQRLADDPGLAAAVFERDPGPAPVRRLTISPDGAWLGLDLGPGPDLGDYVARGVELWSMADGRRILRLDDARWLLAFDPSGRRVAIADAREVRIIELPSGALVERLPRHRAVAGAFHEGGDHLTTISATCEARTWRLGAGGTFVDLPAGPSVGGRVSDAAASVDGTRLGAVCGDRVHRWWVGGDGPPTVHGASGGGLRAALAVHPFDVRLTADAVMVSPSSGAEPSRTWAWPGLDRATAGISAGGRSVAVADDTAIRIWRLDPTPPGLQTLGPERLAVGGSGELVLETAQGPLRLGADALDGLQGPWRLGPDGSLVDPIVAGGAPMARPWDAVESHLVDARGARAVAWLDSGRLLHWPLARPAVHTDPPRPAFFGVAAEATDATAISPGGDRFATMDARGRVRVWDLEHGGEPTVLDVAVGGPRADAGSARLVFGPGGHHLALGRNARSWSWAAATPTRAARMIELGLPGDARFVFGPKGRRLVGLHGRRSRAWSLPDVRAIAEVEHEAGLCAVAFDPDGRRWATSDADGVVRVWRARDGRPVDRVELDVEPDRGCSTLSFGPAGHRLAITEGGRTTVWPIEVEGSPTVARWPTELPLIGAWLDSTGGWLVAVDRGGGIFVQRDASLGVQRARERLSGRVRGCLTVADRMDLLAESPERAAAGSAVCRARHRLGPAPGPGASAAEGPR